MSDGLVHVYCANCGEEMGTALPNGTGGIGYDVHSDPRSCIKYLRGLIEKLRRELEDHKKEDGHAFHHRRR